MWGECKVLCVDWFGVHASESKVDDDGLDRGDTRCPLTGILVYGCSPIAPRSCVLSQNISIPPGIGAFS